MDNPATTKRRRTESEVQPNCHVISDTEEAEEADDIYSESDSDNGDGHGNLATWDTILISELKPNKYARAVSRLQGLGIAIVQDDLPYCMPTAMLAMDIPTHEVEEVAMLLTTKWVLPGCVSIGHFLPARDQIKLAIHITNKAKVAMVTTEALAKYAHCHGINFNHHHMAVSMVALGTWTLTLDNAELATRLTSLYKVILFGKELSICVWKDSFRQAKHWAYVSGILETTSRQGVVEFFRCKCGEIIDHHFGKHLDGRLALWITIQFKKANDLNKALMYNSMVPVPSPPFPTHPLNSPCFPTKATSASMESMFLSPRPRPRRSTRQTSSASPDLKSRLLPEPQHSRPGRSARRTKELPTPQLWQSMNATPSSWPRGSLDAPSPMVVPNGCCGSWPGLAHFPLSPLCMVIWTLLVLLMFFGPLACDSE